MKFERQSIPDVVLITPKRFEDSRGFFSETYHFERFAAAGIKCTFVQDNHSRSAAIGTLRGLHFQAPPKAQDKLVRCISGRLLDVAVDLRAGSPTYLRSVSVELSAKTGQQLFIPAGFAHGFVTLEPDTEAQYKVSEYYDPELDLGIAHDDEDIGLAWPMRRDQLTLSERDAGLPRWRDLSVIFDYKAA